MLKWDSTSDHSACQPYALSLAIKHSAAEILTCLNVLKEQNKV